MARSVVRPRTFFLNEKHELSLADKAGGGRVAQFVDVPWVSKSKRLTASISHVIQAISTSHDPLRDDHYFVIAKPVAEVKKRSVDKKKAPDGTYAERTDFGGAHGRVFDRLGLDLLQVTRDGDAIVHARRERVDQLLDRALSLPKLGAREQARWVTIDGFETIPVNLRVDTEWLSSLKTDVSSDVVFELQPILSRIEADQVVRAIADVLTQAGHRITGSGADFSGRFWFRGKAARAAIRSIARDFFSVESIHSPLFSYASAVKRSSGVARPTKAIASHVPADAKSLPCVAVVDLGIPANHAQLGPYRRGQFVPQYAFPIPGGDHGSFVASRVVFGDHASPDELTDASGRCSIYDAVVGEAGTVDKINDKIVMDALRGVRGAAPDVRVFNLSFGDTRPLAQFPDVEQREKRLLLQDLDNFVFANDVLVVVAAGNSQKGVIPQPDYPGHFDDERWALGPWACGFNTMVCGAYVSHVSAAGLVQTVGWPSPFSRIGPGLCDGPVPSFCAEGGNSDMAYSGVIGGGVLGFSGSGMIEDRMGTSLAAPILAREAALALATLQEHHCAPGTSPYGVTVRAFLALTAQRTTTDDAVSHLADRTLGFGKPSSSRLRSSMGGSAIVIWQGVIENAKDIVRVQLPIPLDWLAEASEPTLRLAACYDPPVNEAARAQWACRRATVTLHPGPEERGLRGSPVHGSYALFLRDYKLARYAPGTAKAAKDDLWVLELSYEQIFNYPPGMDFDPRQRIAFAAELFDRGAKAVDPQPSVQALPIASSMTRLSIAPTLIRTPIVLRAGA